MDIIKNIAALIKVKTLITIAVIAVFTVLSLKGQLSTEVIMGVVTMVIAFYFGTQSDKKAT